MGDSNIQTSLKNQWKIVQHYKKQHQVSITSPLSSALSCASKTFKLSSPVSLSKFPRTSDPVNLNENPDNIDFFAIRFISHEYSHFTE